MYLHIGQNEILPDRRVIGIFDLDKCSYGKRTREYLAAAEKEGVVLDVRSPLSPADRVPQPAEFHHPPEAGGERKPGMSQGGIPWRHIRHW